MLKIATVGGGSSYTPELIDGFIKRYNELPVDELWLCDIEEGKEKLEIVTKLGKRMIEKAGVPIKLISTLDREKALDRADFVTTQLRVGQLEARINDERIPLKHGFFGQETNGAGGLFKGLRTIPVILDICEDMKKLCPNAWLINFTNPVGMVAEAINKHSDFKKFIGLCNVPIDTYKHICSLLEEENVDVHFAGLNHMVFATSIMANGQDKMEEVINNWSTQTVKNISATPWDKNFLKALGVLPCSYHRYYYMQKEYLEEYINEFKENRVRGEVVKKLEKELFEIYKDENLKEKPKQLESRGGAYYSDSACNLISSIYNDKKDIQVVDTVNKGAIPNFEYNEICEVSSVITKNGPVPIAVGKLPKSVNGLVEQIKSFEVIGAEAAVTGDKNKALLALMINPLIQSQEGAKRMLEEMLEANKRYLKNFS